MIVLTLRTDNPEAELGLYDGQAKVAYETWTAHRQLAETLHSKINELLANNNLKLSDIEAIACLAGPGSFTGLRIGLSVANSLAYGLQVPIVAETGDDWIQKSLIRLETGSADPLAMPVYGAEVHITQPKAANTSKH